MEKTPPQDFYKIINDFTHDIINTFPEYKSIIQKWWEPKNFDHIECADEKEAAILEDKAQRTTFVFNHCLKVFPERFVDILYQKQEIFSDDSILNTEFLPGIVFKYLLGCDITDKTRETIWKYLQLILFSVVGNIQSGDLGDTSKIFESIDEGELKSKLMETLSGMQSLFEKTETREDGEDPINMENIPSADDIHSHINGILDGKLGKLAMELAEETAADLDMDNVNSTGDIFKMLFSNQGKLMDMVKNVGSKIDSKIKAGEINESELMDESMGMLNKMKGMPGMENIGEMLSKMGMPGMENMGELFGKMGGMGGIPTGGGNKSKFNAGAMEMQLARNMKMAQSKERMRQKLEERSIPKSAPISSQPQITNVLSDEQLISVFSTGENVEKTPRGAPQPSGKTKKPKTKK
jgi:hypothetical protein